MCFKKKKNPMSNLPLCKNSSLILQIDRVPKCKKKKKIKPTSVQAKDHLFIIFCCCLGSGLILGLVRLLQYQKLIVPDLVTVIFFFCLINYWPVLFCFCFCFCFFFIFLSCYMGHMLIGLVWDWLLLYLTVIVLFFNFSIWKRVANHFQL